MHKNKAWNPSVIIFDLTSDARDKQFQNSILDLYKIMNLQKCLKLDYNRQVSDIKMGTATITEREERYWTGIHLC